MGQDCKCHTTKDGQRADNKRCHQERCLFLMSRVFTVSAHLDFFCLFNCVLNYINVRPPISEGQ